MGKSIHVVSNASGVILKASKDKAACEAYLAGCLGGARHILETVTTPSGDPATLFQVADVKEAETGSEAWHTAYAITTLRLT